MAEYSRHRLECYDRVVAFEVAQEAVSRVQVVSDEVRVSRDALTLSDGIASLQRFAEIVDKLTKLDPGVIAVHNETRGLLLESNIGYNVVFGKRSKRVSPLNDLLLATHQLDWRLGERALAFSKYSQDLVVAVRDTKNAYETQSNSALRAARAAKAELDRRLNIASVKRKAYEVCRQNTRADMWCLENELRVARREASRQHQHANGQVDNLERVTEKLEAWRTSMLDQFAARFATLTATYCDDLFRVGGRLTKCCDYLRVDDDLINAKLQALPSPESRDQRQLELDATAKTKGALVFPPFGEQPAFLAQQPPQEEEDRSGGRAQQKPAYDMPRTALVAKKGVLELERTMGWTQIFAVLSFDAFLHGYPGRTEGAVEYEDPAFRSVDLKQTEILDQDESPEIHVRYKETSFFGTTTTIKLRCKDAADKFAWLRALRNPLAQFFGERQDTANPRDVSNTFV